MNNNMVTVITTKRLMLVLVTVLLLAAALPAFAQESMIPDDFDWSIYLQDWDDDWDSWGSAPAPNFDYGYQDPITYNWYGEEHTLNYPQPTPIPQQYGFGSNDYVPVPVYPQQQTTTESLPTYDNWSQIISDSDGWFYQMTENWYDDFDSWTGNMNTPASAFVSGFNGYAQSYNLDCEARSAVDLAAYFGVNINHSEFLYYLPKSDDPNEGFVGSWTDARGHIPPASYGVYQEPVAALLRKYGLNAVGAYAYTEDALKSQIASGKPVMVWVVGNVELGYSVPYTPASTGHTTYVVPFQHTVVVTGYDENAVYFQDGALRYSRDWNTFLLSWGALGNRAIYVN